MPIDPREPESEPGSDRIEEPEPQSQERQVERELEQTKSAYQRLAADFENYKRRKTQETQDLARYGSAALLTAILPALDNLARAVAHIDPSAQDGLSEGLRLTLRQLEDALLSQGVEKVASVGEPFDPRVHDAVSTVAGEGVGQDTVVAELLPGYRLHERVVRPAQVTVAQASSPGSFGQGSPGEPETDDRLEAPEVTDSST
ncbi:MAG: nucleotide exchange factor GrpE [Candidatus Dormibacteria bacterium]